MSREKKGPKRGVKPPDNTIESEKPQPTAAVSNLLRVTRCVGVFSVKEWTGKARLTIVDKSKSDPFAHDGLFNNVQEDE